MFSLQPLKEKFSKDTETTISLDFVDDYGRMKRRGAGCDILPPIGPLQGSIEISGRYISNLIFFMFTGIMKMINS